MRKIELKLLFITVLTTSIIFNTYCQIYDYPTKPGSSNWKQFKSHNEMIKACQMPDSILLQIPTKNLLESCLNYPLLFDILAYDNFKIPRFKLQMQLFY